MQGDLKQDRAHPDSDGQTGEEQIAGGMEQATEKAPRAAEQEGGAAGESSEVQELRDRHLRLAAEFDNYRKRVERERAESWQRAQGQLAERLLDALDDLQRFTSAEAETLSAEAVLDGVRLIERKILRALEAAGLEPIEAEGQPFDPEVHEALTTVPTEDPEADDSVADVFQRGYRFKGALLRPARVRVHRHEA